MSVAHDHYPDLHRLIDRLSTDQAEAVRPILRLVVGAVDEDEPAEPPQWIGAFHSGRSDTSESVDEILRHRFGQ